jgi:hypothetical protein
MFSSSHNAPRFHNYLSSGRRFLNFQKTASKAMKGAASTTFTLNRSQMAMYA